MFANLLQLITPRPHAATVNAAFVAELSVRESEPRNPRVERLIFVCWLLIAVKHVAIIWACRHYPIPFHQLWINFPTWLLGALATGIYLWRVRRP
jgi:hypothetical protein